MGTYDAPVAMASAVADDPGPRPFSREYGKVNPSRGVGVVVRGNRSLADPGGSVVSTTTAGERLQQAVEPALEVISERVGWLPVVFVPAASPKHAFGCGLRDQDDLVKAQVAVETAEKAGGAVVVGVDDWGHVIPVGADGDPVGSVVVLGRLAESFVPAIERISGLLGHALTGQRLVSGLREQGRDLESAQERLERQLEILEDLRRFGEDLRAVMADGPAGGRLRLLAERLARFSDGPVVLQNANLVLLAGSSEEATDLALAPSRHQSVRDVVSPLAAADGAVEVRPGGELPRRLTVGVRARGELLGFLTAAAEPDDDCRVGPALEIAAGWVAFEHAIRGEIEEDQAYDRDALLFDLATGTAPHRLLERGRRMGFDLSRPYAPCVFAPVPSTAEGVGKLRRVVADAVRAACPSASDSLVGILDDAVVAVVPQELPDGLEALCQSVVTMAKELSLVVRAGVGPGCGQASDYEAGLRQARWVTEVLSLVSPDASWALFADLGVYALLFDRHRAKELDDFVNRWVGPLITYDEVHKTELVTTLRSVLETGGVMTEAAKQLYIHISTLKYRVSRIEELLGVELRNAELAFNLHLACKVLAVRQRLAEGT